MITKLCARCQAPISYPNRYCDKCSQLYKMHELENKKLADRRYNQHRDKKYLKFYKSVEWDVLKAKKLQDTNYLCERCLSLEKRTLADEVHHKKPIQTDDGWLLRLDYNNLKSVCLDCHNYYHNRFQKQGGKRK